MFSANGTGWFLTRFAVLPAVLPLPFFSIPLNVYIDQNPFGFDLEKALAEVSPERREKALRFRFERDRRLSVAAYRLLCRALREAYGIDEAPRFGVHPGGKPYLLDHPGIHFNLSHCRAAVACVVSDEPVGIDVESIAPVDPDVARRVLSALERRRVESSPQPETEFAALWTRKEALVKLRGIGIDDTLLPGLLEESVSAHLDTRTYEGFVLSVASAVPAKADFQSDHSRHSNP